MKVFLLIYLVAMATIFDANAGAAKNLGNIITREVLPAAKAGVTKGNPGANVVAEAIQIAKTELPSARPALKQPVKVELKAPHLSITRTTIAREIPKDLNAFKSNIIGDLQHIKPKFEKPVELSLKNPALKEMPSGNMLTATEKKEIHEMLDFFKNNPEFSKQFLLHKNCMQPGYKGSFKGKMRALGQKFWWAPYAFVIAPFFFDFIDTSIGMALGGMNDDSWSADEVKHAWDVIRDPRRSVLSRIFMAARFVRNAKNIRKYFPEEINYVRNLFAEWGVPLPEWLIDELNPEEGKDGADAKDATVAKDVAAVTDVAAGTDVKGEINGIDGTPLGTPTAESGSITEKIRAHLKKGAGEESTTAEVEDVGSVGFLNTIKNMYYSGFIPADEDKVEDKVISADVKVPFVGGAESIGVSGIPDKKIDFWRDSFRNAAKGQVSVTADSKGPTPEHKEITAGGK